MSKNNAPSVYAEISRIYHDPAASSLVPPLAKIDFLFDNGSMATAFLPSDQLTTSGLKKAVPRLARSARYPSACLRTDHAVCGYHGWHCFQF